MQFLRFIMPVFAAVLLTACSKPAPQTQTPTEVTQDPLEDPRFAVFSPAIGVMLRDLGFEDNIVGRHSYDNALAQSIPVVGSHIEIDDEMLITVDPNILVFEANTIEIPPRIQTLADERGWLIWTHKLESIDDIAITLDDLYLKLVGFPSDANSDDDPLTFEVDPTKQFEIELPSARLARAWSAIGQDAQAAGRILLLAGTDPPGALGPGSFHAQLIRRIGVQPAIENGGMWQQLDLEDIITLEPDSILIFSPSQEQQQIGEPRPMRWSEIQSHLGPIAGIDIPAIHTQQVGVITHPQGLLPSSTLAQVADEIRKTLAAWRERRDSEP
jgi:ABC-type hemin transport system substrate-binding protein